MINIPKGTKDVLPSESYKWQYVENAAREVASLFGAREVRTPVFEHTELFLRGVGETTDIVNKEMYTFKDKGDRSITLKAEGTAPIARSYIENGLANEAQPMKMFYFTPVFRYERPQAGRLREHHQFGVEVYGSNNPSIDAEIIALDKAFLTKVGIKNVELNINSIGCPVCRKAYNEKLREFLKPILSELCETCRDRYEKNPMRILDCKDEHCASLVSNAPKMLDNLCDDCRDHFEKVKNYLTLLGVEYKVNPSIVRGLDYYTKTVFEFISSSLGAQSTVSGGGRYNGLVKQLGGADTSCIGFGLGIERLLLTMEAEKVTIPLPSGTTVYVAPCDASAYDRCFLLVNELRNNGVRADIDHMGRSIKAQFKYADKLRAEYVIAVGENELVSGKVKIKNMSAFTDEEVDISDVVKYFTDKK